MRKIVSFDALKMLWEVKQMTPAQLMDAMCNGKLRDDMAKNCPPEDMTIVHAIDNISSKASCRISRIVSQMHGKVSDVNPPTPERRGDYFRLCLFVASNIFSRALAMYEPEDREKLLGISNSFPTHRRCSCVTRVIAMLQQIITLLKAINHRINQHHVTDSFCSLSIAKASNGTGGEIRS